MVVKLLSLLLLLLLLSLLLVSKKEILLFLFSSRVKLSTEFFGRCHVVVIYKAFCLDVAQGHINGAPNETRTFLCRFASLVC